MKHEFTAQDVLDWVGDNGNPTEGLNTLAEEVANVFNNESDLKNFKENVLDLCVS